jgi:hypothetical protein
MLRGIGSNKIMAQNPQGSPLGPNAVAPFKARGVGGRNVPKTATSKRKPCHITSGDGGGKSPKGQTKSVG